MEKIFYTDSEGNKVCFKTEKEESPIKNLSMFLVVIVIGIAILGAYGWIESEKRSIRDINNETQRQFDFREGR
jgi:hypothetical protein